MASKTDSRPRRVASQKARMPARACRSQIGRPALPPGGTRAEEMPLLPASGSVMAKQKRDLPLQASGRRHLLENRATPFMALQGRSKLVRRAFAAGRWRSWRRGCRGSRRLGETSLELVALDLAAGRTWELSEIDEAELPRALVAGEVAAADFDKFRFGHAAIAT